VPVFYLGPHARITDQVFEERRPPYRCFAIRELEAVYMIRGTNGWTAARVTPVRVCSGALSGVAGLVAVVGAPILGNTPLTAVATVALVVSAATSQACRRFRLRPHELWAVHRDGLVCLYRTTDATTFGQVRRAMIRVIEWRDGLR